MCVPRGLASKKHVVAVVDGDGQVAVKATSFGEDAAGYQRLIEVPSAPRGLLGGDGGDRALLAERVRWAGDDRVRRRAAQPAPESTTSPRRRWPGPRPTPSTRWASRVAQESARWRPSYRHRDPGAARASTAAGPHRAGHRRRHAAAAPPRRPRLPECTRYTLDSELATTLALRSTLRRRPSWPSRDPSRSASTTARTRSAPEFAGKLVAAARVSVGLSRRRHLLAVYDRGRHRRPRRG